MAIRFTKYINILSSVGAGVVAPGREFITRIFTTNPLLPTNSYIEFETLEEVGVYFGTASDEYKRAIFYFSWISKNNRSPNKLAFARWTNANVAPKIFGARLTATLATFTAISNGSITLTLGGVTNLITSLNFTSATTLADVATVLQNAIHGPSGTQWTASTVAYDATAGAFNFVGGSAVVANVVVAAGSVGTDIATLIGWLPESVNGSAGAIWSDGNLIETITAVLTNSAGVSNNFGSFLFIPALDLAQITEAAVWNNNQNIFYMYLVRVADLTDAANYYAALVNYAGVALTLAPLSTEYPEMIPGMIQAATDYDAINSVQNYMFQIFNLTPSVNTTTNSDAYDLLRVNYYGQTQTAGRLLQFYQRGYLLGASNMPSDMNVYANEAWFKDAMGAEIMTLLLAIGKISANEQGRTLLLAILQAVIDRALANGTISVQGILTSVQKLYISNVTSDSRAWYQVQNIGYWLNCIIQPVVVNSVTEYQAVYTLVYKKDDNIRRVNGSHILI